VTDLAQQERERCDLIRIIIDNKDRPCSQNASRQFLPTAGASFTPPSKACPLCHYTVAHGGTGGYSSARACSAWESAYNNIVKRAPDAVPNEGSRRSCTTGVTW
jgi:hypothetical protein